MPDCAGSDSVGGQFRERPDAGKARGGGTRKLPGIQAVCPILNWAKKGVKLCLGFAFSAIAPVIRLKSSSMVWNSIQKSTQTALILQLFAGGLRDSRIFVRVSRECCRFGGLPVSSGCRELVKNGRFVWKLVILTVILSPERQRDLPLSSPPGAGTVVDESGRLHRLAGRKPN